MTMIMVPFGILNLQAIQNIMTLHHGLTSNSTKNSLLVRYACVAEAVRGSYLNFIVIIALKILSSQNKIISGMFANRYGTLVVSLYKGGNLVHRWESESISGDPYKEDEGLLSVFSSRLAWHVNLMFSDPLWLRFDRTSNPVGFDQLNITFSEVAQIAAI